LLITLALGRPKQGSMRGFNEYAPNYTPDSVFKITNELVRVWFSIGLHILMGSEASITSDPVKAI
jgi:hypothetical protein